MIYNDPLINRYYQHVLDNTLLDFYIKWKNRYLRTVKFTIPRKEYLFYTLDQPTDNNAVTCSEAMGYGMVIFPIMSKFDSSAQNHFNYLYNFIKSYPSFYNNNLMAWQQIIDSKGNILNANNQTSSATDGDMDISYGLLLANKIWGYTSCINYKDEAILRIKAIMDSCVDDKDYFLTLGDWVKGLEVNKYKNVTRSSDFIIYILKEFANADYSNNLKWKKVINKCNSIIKNQLTLQSKHNGLMPDFLVKEGNVFKAPTTVILESIHDGDYFSNSCRTPWRYSMDTLINNVPISNNLKILNRWIKKETKNNPNEIKSGYYLANGKPGKPFGSNNNLAFIAPFLVSSLLEKGNDTWKIELWEILNSKSIEQCTFYENTLKLIAMIIATGHWIS